MAKSCLGKSIADTVPQEILGRLPEKAREGVWGEMSYGRFEGIFIKGNASASEIIAASLHDREGNELLTSDEIKGMPMSVVPHLIICITYVNDLAKLEELTEELSDPK